MRIENLLDQWIAWLTEDPARRCVADFATPNGSRCFIGYCLEPSLLLQAVDSEQLAGCILASAQDPVLNDLPNLDLDPWLQESYRSLPSKFWDDMLYLNDNWSFWSRPVAHPAGFNQRGLDKFLELRAKWGHITLTPALDAALVTL